ncbi:tripartite motif-containing protein 3-like [Branchiostoma floridae x Branchiostoma belcheri]
MASKFPTPEDFDEQFLTCAICMLNYRDPKILPCLHSFCRECLQDWATKQQPLECPTCREPVSLPDQGVDGLRTNFYVNNLLDFAAVKKVAGPGVPCQVCEGGQEQNKSWCADCGMLLCGSCIDMHRKVPATRDHQMVPQEDINTMGGTEGLERKLHCHKHKNQELVFYCESCNALVCTACTVVDHRPGKDHNPVEIATVAQNKTEELRELLKQIDPRLKEMEASLKEVDKKMSKLIPLKEEATDQAKAYFRKLADLLQKREEEILSQIDEQCRADGKALQTKKEAIEFELAGLTSAQMFCQQAVEHGSDVHVLEVGNQVKTRVETLLAKEVDLESEWSEFKFVEKSTVEDCAEQVANLGFLNTKVDVSKCVIVVKPAIERFKSFVVLTTRNKEGRPCVDSKGVTANIRDPSGTNVPTQVQRKSESEWEISYVPKVKGNHRLEVNVNSQQVAGSPFYVKVQDRDAPLLTIGKRGRRVAELDSPLGVAVDKDGNIAVVDRGNNRVQILDANTGQSLNNFPVEGENPFDIDVDSNGSILVTSYGENFGIRCYSKDGNLSNILKPTCLLDPSGLTVLKDGRMVVADHTRQSCLLLQPDGSLIREIGKEQLEDPRFVAVDELRGLMFATDYEIRRVFSFDLEGNYRFDFGNEGQNNSSLQGPNGITLDPAGNIIVGNIDDGRVQMFGPDGTFMRTVATVKGNETGGLALTPDGYIVVACYKAHCIELYRYMW